MPLDAAQVEIVRTLWAGGLSMVAIAAEVGTTLGTIAGKLSRMGLMGRGDRPRGALGRGIKLPRVKAPTIVPAPEPEPADIGISFDDLRDSHCRWPYGDGPFRYCGAQRLAKCSYCSAHELAAHRGPK